MTHAGPDTDTVADGTARPSAAGSPADPAPEEKAQGRRSRRVEPSALGAGTAGDEEPAPRARRRPSVPLVPVLAGLLVLLLAAATWLALPWFRGDAGSPVRTDSYVEVLQAARSGIVDLTSFDALTIDDDIEQVRRVATGDLRDESLAQLQDRRQELVDAQAVVQTEVVGAGVVSAGEDTGTVLLVIQSTQQSTAAPQAQVLRYRIQVELVRQDGRWLLSGISGR
ncbi:Mce-associated membrane protein [Geodermatophilus normandii]|uniref:Mce-associated membrane protein n=1 Tax=Geodermatophilus normandii TaxID=1137989 RepID=A0A317QIG7_9ACTN|nr:hypothetical protein [Geodermatophilus normandii]PWW22753.1 Mce-associated membrane protein [Geodermatophilus normandii]